MFFTCSIHFNSHLRLQEAANWLDCRWWLDSGFFIFSKREMQYATAKSAWALVWAKFEISSDKWSILICGSCTEKGEHIRFGLQCSMRGAVCQCICSSWGGLDVRNDNWIHIHIHSIKLDYKLKCMPCWLVLLLHFWKESLQYPALQPGRWQCWWAGQDQGRSPGDCHRGWLASCRVRFLSY